MTSVSTREVICPSGAVLTIRPAPFVDAKNLYQSLLRELRSLQVDTKMELASLYKELFCVGFSSVAIEANLWKCFQACTYDRGDGISLKIDKDTFEPLASRDDYMVVCMEVAKDNVGPFGKSLYAEYVRLSQMIETSQK